jgi:hypothetical protein
MILFITISCLYVKLVLFTPLSTIHCHFPVFLTAAHDFEIVGDQSNQFQDPFMCFQQFRWCPILAITMAWHTHTHTHTLWLQWKASSRHRPSLLVEGKRETTNRVLMFYKKKMRHRLRQKSLEDVNMLFDFVPFAIKQIIVSLSHSQVIKILIYIRGINSYLNYKRSGTKIWNWKAPQHPHYYIYKN